MRSVCAWSPRPTSRIACAVALCVVMLVGCATAPQDDAEALAAFKQTNDPLEPLNRVMFDFNLFLDKLVLAPVALVYRETVPPQLRDVAKNMLDNLKSPVTFANDLLQLEFGRANDTAWRFVLNSAYGFFGAADVATEFGIPAHEEDFGQTLAVAGVGEGPFLMVPFVGPMNPRDGAGKIVDFFLDPFGYLVDDPFFGVARTGMDALDLRARRYNEINDLERSSLDYYATLRSLYRQSRNDLIRNGLPAPVVPANGNAVPDIPDMPDMPDIPEMPESPVSEPGG